MAFEGNIQCIPGAIGGAGLGAATQYHCVVPETGEPNQWVRVGTAGAWNERTGCWVHQSKSGEGDAASIAFAGVTKVIAGAQVYPGRVMANALGHVIMATPGYFALGFALNSAAVGEYVSVQISPSWVPNHPEELAGTMAGAGSISGDMDGAVALEETLYALSTMSGNLTVACALAGSMAGASAVGGYLGVAADLGGLIAGAGSIDSADLEAACACAGTMATDSAASGDLKAECACAGEVAAQSSVSAYLGVAADLGGLVAAAGTMTGDLKAECACAGAVASDSTMTGDLTKTP